MKVWNDDLARVAQNYAEKCVFAHNLDRTSQQSSFTCIGENIAAETGAANYTQLVQLWDDESMNYIYSTMSCTPGKQCGHYTQV